MPFPGGLIAGTDEAGRGPLAGPVVAAAAVLTDEQSELLLSSGLNDSKKLTAKRREALFSQMCGMGVLWRAQAASPHVIDRINILQASLWCMKRALLRLPEAPALVLVDGNVLIPGLELRQEAIVKGDSRVPAIAAASVVAKVLRDRVMTVMDRIYPQYGFAKHKGYPSALHISRIAEYGPLPIHRLSFRGVASVGR
ncbi:MAG: ribonuclease HII [Synergistaceae bacterium]|nr:ribonuclease HII [Synergistaceae bacterium]